MMGIFDRILRAGEGKTLKKIERIAGTVNLLEDEFQSMSDAELKAMTLEFKERLLNGETLDDILPEAFATVREASWRVLGQRHYDVQIMGGAALHLGCVAEMKTGEGKTLVSTLPAYLNALTGEGVHVVTVNDYLALRDRDLMGPIHEFLGLTCGCITETMTPQERQVEYARDITYGTNNEFGFDYLRDNMATSLSDMTQRGHHYAIVDEVDSILIDEARTPLILSGQADLASQEFLRFAGIGELLTLGEDYEIDEKLKTVGVLESGIEKAEKALGVENLYEAENTQLVNFLNSALKAKDLYKKDKEYVILKDQVFIVDEHTGRILDGRRYQDGVHQAIEAREGVPIRPESQTMASITLQNYFRLYSKLSGMTGTAMTEDAELHAVYGMLAVPIPTNRPMIRQDKQDLIYRTKEAKYEAITEDVLARIEKGQPVLLGTTSVENSEIISDWFKENGIEHQVLNAKNHAREAEIVAQAGRKSAVTVATNMAGRGTDIILGGNAEQMAKDHARARAHDAGLKAAAELEEGTEDYETSYRKAFEEEYERVHTEEYPKAKAQADLEHEEVVKAGGLYVLGTERHESRRIDNQLRGRGGRQGDPGESRFYLSLEDELMRLFKSDTISTFLTRFNVPDSRPIDNKMITNAVKSAQNQIESRNAQMRAEVLKYDDVMNLQRKLMYKERYMILSGENLEGHIRRFLDNVIKGYVQDELKSTHPETWETEKLWADIRRLYPLTLELDDIVEESGGSLEALTEDYLISVLQEDAQAAYTRRAEELHGAEFMREFERQMLMLALDAKWREHLYEMEYLREGIGLRSQGQRNPLVEYKREGYTMFSAMLDAIRENTVSYLFTAEVTFEPNGEETMITPEGAEEPDMTELTRSEPDEDGNPVELPPSTRTESAPAGP